MNKGDGVAGEAFTDVFCGLYRAAMEQPSPTEELKSAIEVARSAAMGLRQPEVRDRIERSFCPVKGNQRAERLAENLLKIYEDEE